jgi:hypothetical protein
MKNHPLIGDTVRYHSTFQGEYDRNNGPHPAEVIEIWDEGVLRLIVRPENGDAFDVGFVAHKDLAQRDGRWWELVPEKAPVPAALDVYKL